MERKIPRTILAASNGALALKASVPCPVPYNLKLSHYRIKCPISLTETLEYTLQLGTAIYGSFVKTLMRMRKLMVYMLSLN